MEKKAKKILSWVLQIPLLLLMIASFFGSIYAAYYKIQGITYATPMILGIIIVLYIVGRYMGMQDKHHI